MTKRILLLLATVLCLFCVNEVVGMSRRQLMQNLLRRQSVPEEESDGQIIIELFDEDGDVKLSHEELEDLFRSLFSADEHGHGEEEVHNHEEGEPEMVLKSSAAKEEEGQAHEHAHEVECRTPTEVFTKFDLNTDSLLDVDEFNNASSTLLLNVINKCRIVEEEASCAQASTAVTWISGIAAAIVVSLISLVAVIFIPFGKYKVDQIILAPLVSFSVGALLGDAFLHLIPDILEIHSHSEGGEEEEPGEKEYLLPMSIVLLSILSFFLLERQLEHVHNHVHPAQSVELPEMDDSSNHPTPTRNAFIKQVDGEKPLNPMDAIKKEASEAKPFGYLSLFADGLHNFTDGLAIGAAFSASVGTGLSTAIAVVLHEIPQELGDFAILIKAGFSKRTALLFNLLSALTALVGCLFGLGIGSVDGATRYILSFTTGGFIYVALANMVPELQKEKGWKNTLLQIAAVLLGFILMLVIALWLEEIKIC